MKLRALYLTNVRKFTGKRAAITGIGPGITVVSEANEFGKSTFFDAIHALFFEKYGSSAKPVKSLQPYAGGAVEVAAEIETDEGLFLVEKRFLSRKMARIVRLSDKTTIAQDDEAERWITTLLGAGDGPAGLLWVRQGLLGLEPENPRERTAQTETRRDLLSSVAGEIDAMTGGRRMDRVMRRVAEDLADIATKTGRKSGAWKMAFDEAEALKAALATLTDQVATLEIALADRKADEALLARLDLPDAKVRRQDAVLAAQAALEAARAHAGLVNAARQERDIAALHAESATSDFDAILLAAANLTTAERAAQATAAKAEVAETAAATLKTRLATANTADELACGALKLARLNLDAARRQMEARKARTEAAQLATRIEKAEAAQAQLDQSAALVKASLATADWLSRTEAAAGDVVRHEAALQAQSTTLKIHYSGQMRIALNGIPVPDNLPVLLDGEVGLDVPGIGQMTIRAQPQTANGSEQLAKAKQSRDGLLSKTGADTIGTARLQAGQRADAARQADLAKAVLETFAPDGIAALRTSKAEAELAAAEAHDDQMPSLADLFAQVTELISQQEQSAGSVRDLAAEHASAHVDAVTSRAAAAAAAQALEQAAATAGPSETRDTRRVDLMRAQAMTAETELTAETALAKVSAVAPDLATVAAELKRAEDATTAAAGQRTQVAIRLAECSAQIRSLAGNGIEERRDEVRGQLEAALANDARFEKKHAALTRLQAALETERTAAQETYFGPVQQELKPLLSILHSDAALGFDSDSLLPTSLTRGLSAETLDDLSGGTREQIAILTRLAFARLFARQGRHLPIVLDDALVYSDDDRIIKMFTALTRVAQDQQIIVFSCRQLAFQDLGGARPGVEISLA